MLGLIEFALLASYIYGAWRFWKGFTYTNFNQTLSSRISLSLLWPALFITNQSYRRNFRKALKG